MIATRCASFAGYATRVLAVDGEGPPFVFLHGFADGADQWRRVLIRLAREGRTALAVDMPGFAQADRLDRRRAILEQLDAFVQAIVAAQNEPPVLAGHSLGGCVALRAAQEGEVAAVAAVASAGLDMARWFFLAAHPLVAPVLIGAAGLLPPRLVRAATARSYAGLYARPRAVDPTVVAANVAYLRDRATVRRLLVDGRRLLGELADPFELERIECPVLLVWGDRDRLSLPSSATRLADALSHARLLRLSDCGHMPMIEEPDAVTGALLELVAAPRAQQR